MDRYKMYFVKIDFLGISNIFYEYIKNFNLFE